MKYDVLNPKLTVRRANTGHQPRVWTRLLASTLRLALCTQEPRCGIRKMARSGALAHSLALELRERVAAFLCLQVLYLACGLTSNIRERAMSLVCQLALAFYAELASTLRAIVETVWTT